MKKFIVFIVTVLCLCGCSNNEVEIGAKDIDTTTVFSEIDNNSVYIIDVREVVEYNSGHIKNAYNIPLGQIKKVSEIVEDLDTKIIVYCQSGNRSGMAAKQLLEMGYTNIYDMGGIISWNYELITE